MHGAIRVKGKERGELVNDLVFPFKVLLYFDRGPSQNVIDDIQVGLNENAVEVKVLILNVGLLDFQLLQEERHCFVDEALESVGRVAGNWIERIQID